MRYFMGNKHKYIGVFGSCLYEQNSMSFLSALREACRKSGYTTIALSASIKSLEDYDSAEGQLRLFDLFRYIELDCIILLTTTTTYKSIIDSLVEIGKERNIPVFSIDQGIDGCYNLLMDYKSAFEDMVHHVIREHNVSRINMIAGLKNNPFSEERIEAYKNVLAEYNIPFEEERLKYGDFWERPTITAVNEIINSNLPLPEAIICANDTMAITTCSILSDHGYSVPDDIIVTGFDGTQSGTYNLPSITTCDPNYANALKFIFKEIDAFKQTKQVVPKDHMIKFFTWPRQSCGCLKKSSLNYAKIISSLYDSSADSTWHMLAMNKLVTKLLDKHSLEDVAEQLPDTAWLWSTNFRFACVKSHITKSSEVHREPTYMTGSFDEMTTILKVKNQCFDKELTSFNIKDFIPNLDDIIEKPGTTFVVRLISHGKQVYGYTVDEFDEIDSRALRRCNEFDMFLAHSVNTVLHNFEAKELNKSLERAYDEIASLSIHDPMTGVYNRRGFFTKINTLLESQYMKNKYLYIVYVDLDGLKKINDTYGHNEGDFAITTVAQALQKLSVVNPLCARFGGDEFICAFFHGLPNAYNAKNLKVQLMSIIRQSPMVSQKEYSIDFSIGVLFEQVDSHININDIITTADQKMYANKLEKKRKQTT